MAIIFLGEKLTLPIIEIAFGVYMLGCLVLAVWSRQGMGSAPFLAIFCAGYFYVGFNSIYALHRMSRGEASEEETEKAAEPELSA